MAIVLEVCITEEQHSVVLFLWAKGLNAQDIPKEMFPAYGGKCLLCKAAYKWVEKFSGGHRFTGFFFGLFYCPVLHW
jgi:hypothetical protein